jgi:hypothetical protein
MQPKTCFLVLLAPLIFACNGGRHSDTDASSVIADSTATALQGSYSGKFKSGLLTLVINYISGNTVSGYDLHKGVRRNVNGEIEKKAGQYALVLREPGGNPFDGIFYLTMDQEARTVNGRWVPVDSSRTHSAALTLTRGTKQDAADSTGGYVRTLYDDRWEGDLGTLYFTEDNTCKLEYYPDSNAAGATAQLVTVNGNYVQSADTVLIDWQNNKRTPTLHMRLTWQHRKEIDDSTRIPEDLHGKGVKFLKNDAG